MKIHTIDYDTYLNISHNKLAVYFRNSYLRKEPSFEKDDISELYNGLTDSEKHIVTGLVNDLLPEKKKNAHIGIFFNEFLEQNNLTYYKLAEILFGYVQTSVECENKLEFDYLKSRLQKLLASSKSNEDDFVIDLVVDFFNVSYDVLLKGEGKKYSIDLERLYEIVVAEKLDADSFLKEHSEIAYDFEYNENKEQQENDKELYEMYIHHSAKTFAKIVEQQFNIECSEILIEEDIWVEWNDNIFVDIFNKLAEQNQIAVVNVLKKMYLKKSDSEIR